VVNFTLQLFFFFLEITEESEWNFGEEKNVLVLPVFEHRTVQPKAQSQQTAVKRRSSLRHARSGVPGRVKRSLIVSTASQPRAEANPNSNPKIAEVLVPNPHSVTGGEWALPSASVKYSS
jgi:hypothetical protein